MVDQAMGFGDHFSGPPSSQGRHRSGGAGVFDAVLIAGGLAFTASLALSFVDGRYPNLYAERQLIGPYTDSPGLFQSAILDDENAVLRWHLRTAMDPVALAQVLFDAVSAGPAPYVAEFLSFFQHEVTEFAGLGAASVPSLDSSAQLVNLGVALQSASGGLTFRPGGGGGWSGAGTAVPWLFEWPAWLPVPPWLQLPPWVVVPPAAMAFPAQLLPVALPPVPAPVVLEIAVPSFVAPPPPAPLPPPAPELLSPPPPPPPPAPVPAPEPVLMEPVLAPVVVEPVVAEPVLTIPEPIVVEVPPAPEPSPPEVIFTPPAEPVGAEGPPPEPDGPDSGGVFDSGILGSGSQVGPYGTDKPAETGGTDTTDPTGPTGPTGPTEGGGTTDSLNTTADTGDNGSPANNTENEANDAGNSGNSGDSNGDGPSGGDTSPSP